MSTEVWPDVEQEEIITCDGSQLFYNTWEDGQVTDCLEGTAIHPSGTSMGAVVVMIGVDRYPRMHEVHVQPVHQASAYPALHDVRTPLQTVRHSIRLLQDLEDALQGGAEQVSA